MSEKKRKTIFEPLRIEASKQDNFDKYYLDVTEKEVFKPSGEVDPDTNDPLGTIEKKLIIKLIDIQEFLESQRDSVGVEAYMRNLALQGQSIDEFNTVVDDSVQDFSQMPDTLADVMMAGDNAKRAFDAMDPALKGSHTTIEGFLNSLTQESIDSYIKGRIEALTPSSNKEGE